MTERDTPFDDPAARFDAGRFGMWIFLVVLAVTFAATIFGYLVVRIGMGGDFVPPDAPPPPKLLLASTAMLLVSSWTMQRALRFGREGDPRQGGMMVATSALALAFLVLQVVAWRELLDEDLGPTDSLYGWTFYVLTAIHAAHVVGGLIPMGIVGIVYCAMYWHFLDAVWVVLYATLWIGSIR